jgi:crossover junction endodeoxyribonuclease RuvC
VLILGIDPGTRLIGYGLIDIENGICQVRDYGCFRINTRQTFPARLKQIHESISKLLNQTQPDVMVVEEVFVSHNAKSTLKLGHARGVILLAAQIMDIPIVEYAPREIKQAVVGRGNASKQQVQGMLNQILRLQNNNIQEDAADGLAAALCHCFRALRTVRT